MTIKLKMDLDNTYFIKILYKSGDTEKMLFQVLDSDLYLWRESNKAHFPDHGENFL